MLEALLNSDDELVRNTATLVQKYKEALEQKLITKVEHDELVADVLDLQRLEKLCSTMEQKAAIRKAVEALKEIAGFVI